MDMATHAGVKASAVSSRPSLQQWMIKNHPRYTAMVADIGGYDANQLAKIVQDIGEYSQREVGQNNAIAKARLDAITNGFTSAQLRYIEAEIFRKEFPPLFYRDVLGPCVVSIPEGYRDYLWRQTTSVGEAAPITNDASDAPSVDLFLEEFNQRFQAYAVSYGWSAMDEASEKVGQMPITIEKGMDCVDRMERRFNTIAETGDSDYGLSGMFSYPDVPVLGTTTGYTQTVASNWMTLIAGTDAQKTQFITAFTAFLQAIVTGSNYVERGPFVVAVPIDLWFALNNTPRSSISDTTLMTFLKGNNPLLRDILIWPNLATAGASGGERVIAFTRDPRKVKYLEVARFKSMPPRHKSDFSWSIANYGISGGVIFPKPHSALYFDLT